MKILEFIEGGKRKRLEKLNPTKYEEISQLECEEMIKPLIIRLLRIVRTIKTPSLSMTKSLFKVEISSSFLFPFSVIYI